MKNRGFTLIELLVSIAVLVILATIAIPRYSEFRQRQEMVAVKNEIQALISAARGEAIKRRVDVAVERGASDGWPVIVKYSDAEGDVVIAERQSRNGSVDLAWFSGGSLVFDRFGRAEQSRILCFYHANG